MNQRKLTPEDVSIIRAALAERDELIREIRLLTQALQERKRKARALTNRAMSVKHGISHSSVRRIQRWQVYKEIRS